MSAGPNPPEPQQPGSWPPGPSGAEEPASDPWSKSSTEPSGYPTPPAQYPPPDLTAPPPPVPPTPPPAYGQDQPPYGQPAYGQPQGQPAYGQPGQQPPFGQAPQYGQPGQQPPFGQAPQYAAGQYPVGQYPAPGTTGTWPGQAPADYGAYAPVPPPPKRKGARVLAIVGSVLALAVIAGAVRGIPVLLGAIDDNASSHPTASVPSGDTATSDATAAPTEPFAGTPAATYPEGEAGITMPAAKAVSGFTRAQVAAALEKVKAALIATRLDPKMLGGDSTGLIGMLAQDARDSIKKDFENGQFFSYATQIAPGYSLTSDKIRVKGRVTFRAAKEGDIRVLEVITKFVWVYPFTGELKEPGDHLVIVQDEVHWMIPVDADVERSSRGLWINSAESFASNIDCELLDKSLLALGKPQIVVGGGDQDEDALFDPNAALDQFKETC